MMNSLIKWCFFAILTNPCVTFAFTSRVGITKRVGITSSRITSLQKAASIKIVEPFGKGLSEDFARKAPFYVSDFKDGLSSKNVLKSLSSTFFLFFACLSPAIAFGGLLTVATKGAMGTVEAVGATAIGGILYALFSGQPITIIGTTGPLLAFLKVLYDACASQGKREPAFFS